MPDLSLLWRKHRHIAPPGTLGVATSSYNSGKCGVNITQAIFTPVCIGGLLPPTKALFEEAPGGFGLACTMLSPLAPTLKTGVKPELLRVCPSCLLTLIHTLTSSQFYAALAAKAMTAAPACQAGHYQRFGVPGCDQITFAMLRNNFAVVPRDSEALHILQNPPSAFSSLRMGGTLTLR